MALKPKQKAFADAYIENGGNATQAAISAGYSSRFTNKNAGKLRQNTAISAYIAERQRELDEKNIASLSEIQTVRTSIIRDEEKSPQDRLKAASDLEKALNIKAERDALTANDKAYELPARVISRGFCDINREIQPNIEYVFEGGRGGGKSSYISLKIVELLKNNPQIHACIVRKVAGTLRDSVYSQMKWAIHELGLDEQFAFKVSPLEITYKATGQTIYFRGVDDPIKLKSIKPPFGYIGILWKEEKDQLAGDAEERSINQSILRGGALSYDFSSYNPPRSRASWVNKIKLVPNDKRVIHHSVYTDIPKEWLGQKFYDDAEHLREVNPEAYEHEYLGVANGDGGNVFQFIEARTITDDEIAGFDRIYQGIDWGWFPDPLAFIRLHYNHAQERIYLIDELYRNKMSNRELADWLRQREYYDYNITCDSAEPKSVNDLKDNGLPAFPAVKGAGSVEYGMKYLQARTIVIDPARTPNAYKEITEYEYERDKDGNIMSGYPDKNNHAIDAIRYALERMYNRRYNNA